MTLWMTLVPYSLAADITITSLTEERMQNLWNVDKPIAIPWHTKRTEYHLPRLGSCEFQVMSKDYERFAQQSQEILSASIWQQIFEHHATRTQLVSVRCDSHIWFYFTLSLKPSCLCRKMQKWPAHKNIVFL